MGALLRMLSKPFLRQFQPLNEKASDNSEMPFSTHLLREPVAVKPPYNGEYGCHIERPIFATSELAHRHLALSPPSLKPIDPAHKFLAF